MKVKSIIKKRDRYKMSVSVFVFLIKEDQILLLPRINTGWMDNRYSVPAGAVEGGESLNVAAMRELKEEVGVEVTQKDLIHAHTISSLTEEEEWTGVFFASQKWKGKITLREPDKHGEPQWFSLSDLPENMIPYVKQAIENFTKGIGYSEYGWEKGK